MKLNMIIAVIGLILLVGCATSPYRVAEEYQENMEYDKAIREYVIMLDPHTRNGKNYIYYDREIVTRIGAAYWQKQSYETAAKILRLVVERDPDYGKALYYLSMSYEALGNEDQAIQTSKKYTSLSGSDPFRQVLFGRLDYLVRRKVLREIQAALQNEEQLRITDFPEKSVAVLYFLNLSNDPQWAPLQKGLAEMLITDLSQAEELKVIERLRLNGIMDELQLSVSGLMDERSTPRVGKLLGVRNLVQGSYIIRTNQQMNLDAGIYRQDGAASLPPNSYESDLRGLFQIEKELVLYIFDYFGIELTPEQRERILQYPTDNMEAFQYYCMGLDALDIGDFNSAQDYFSQAVRIDGDFHLARDWLINSDLWDATHNRNLIRADYVVSQIIRTTPEGKTEYVYTPPAGLISTWSRLQSMNVQQRTGFVPGNNSRETFQEANIMGAEILPTLLGEPPKPGF